MLKLIRMFGHVIRRGRLEAELRRELEHHRSMKQEALERAGLSARDAERASRRALGNVALAREDARQMWIGRWIDGFCQDVRYGLRSLARHPGTTMVALATLGCAIGLNTSLFTAFNAIVWRPWPVNEPARVVNILTGRGHASFTLAEHAYFAGQSRSFSGLIAMRCIDGLSEGCVLELDDQEVRADFVTGNYFQVLEIQMARGAGFAAEHDRRGAPLPVAVISESLWQRRFDADPGIIGRGFRLDDVSFTIVGVTARGFRGTSSDPKDVWLPVSSIARLRAGHVFDDGKRSAVLAGRLADGVSREQARAELELLSRQFRSERGLSVDGVRLVDTSFFPNPAKREGVYPAFAILMAAVLLVLGLACANVGNLLLARATARRHETAVRLSLGAGRSRLVRQLLTESSILAAAATAIGMGIAWFLPSFVLDSVRAFNFPMTPDYTVFAYSAGLMVVTCLGFGLVPACHASREAVAGALKSRVELVAGGISIRGVLLAAQVAITVLLLVNAGLLVRGVQRLSGAEPGIVIDGVSVVSFKLPASYEIARARAFAGQLLAGGAGLPDAARAGFASSAPFVQTGRTWVRFFLPDAPAREDDALVIEASPGYFDVLGLPVLAGRTFTAADTGRPVVVINESTANRLWPRAGAVGRTVVVAGTARQVVGVARDSRTYYGNIHEVFPTVYEPIGTRVIPQLLVRHLDEASRNAVAGFASRLEPRARVEVTPLSELRGRLVSRSMFGAQLAGGLGALALILASVGLFSVFAYVVQQRTREIGIRMALGARPGQVVRAIAGDSSRALIVGLLVGGSAAVLGSRLIRNQLHGVSAFDPAAYLGAAAVLTAAGLLATYIPARRAARVDPTTALRCE